MGFSISDLNPVSLLGDAAQALGHEALPPDLRFVGDLVGIGCDFESGNWMKGIQHFTDLVHDLPQSLASWAAEAKAPGDRTFLEPTPPPAYAPSRSNPSVMSSGTDLASKAAAKTLAAAGGTGSPSTLVAPDTAPSTGASGSVGTAAPASPGPYSDATPAAASTLAVASTSTSAAASVATAPSASTPVAASASVATPSSASSSVSASTSASTPAPASASAAPAGPTSADDAFLNQSPADLLTAVANGNIPDSVRNNPALMQELLARVNQITDMNHLISQMLAAIHEMNNQVIQNIRA